MQLLSLLSLVAAASAAPQLFNGPVEQFVQQPEIRILSQRFEQDQAGNYEYGYDQSNGQKVEETGQVRPGSEPETGAITQRGSYEFVADDGITYRVSYVADELGFQPKGDHLPVAPAQIPEYAQLRRDYPQLFWADNLAAGTLVNGQQFNDGQFIN